nr:DUF58 domain-containing protein [Spelaeibacter cavernicola]
MPSRLAFGIALCAAVASVTALIGLRPELLVFAAPFIGVLASMTLQRPATTVRVRSDPAVFRCFETESANLNVTVESVGEAAGLALSSEPVVGMTVETTAVHSAHVALGLTAQRWGRYLVPVRVTASPLSGLFTGTATVRAAEVHVYPLASPQPTSLPRTELPDRLGTHLTRHHGPGVEYADIRPYVPGDQLRTVNWAVSARRGRLHITERLTDRAADVVVLIDTYPQASGPATEAMERSVRGATQVVQSALQRGDRAGVIGLGRSPRWLGADIGRRQFYRILDTVLSVGDEFRSTTGTLAPRAAMPTGAVVVAFSTLLDTEFALAVIDLRKRRHRVVVVDVLHGSPFADELDPMSARMWRLERAAMYRDMGTVGVDVVSWREETTLDQVMNLVPDRSGMRGR